MIRYTSTELLESIRNLGGCGDTRSTGNRDEDILRHVNEALKEKVLPEINSIQEEYFIKRAQSTVISGRARIHSRASWNRLRDLYYLPSAGASPRGLDAIDTANRRDYASSGGPYGFYLENNDIVLVGSAPTGSLIEQAFVFRPGEMVLLEETRRVISVDPLTSTVVLDAPVPASWDDTAFAPSANPTLLDVHTEESGAEIIDWSLPVTSIIGDTIIFSGPIDGSIFGRKPLAVGQFVVLEGESALPGIPREWIPLLIRATAARLAEAIGDEVMIKAHGSIGQQMTKINIKNAEQRIDSKPMRVTGRRGPLRAARGW